MFDARFLTAGANRDVSTIRLKDGFTHRTLVWVYNLTFPFWCVTRKAAVVLFHDSFLEYYNASDGFTSFGEFKACVDILEG